MLRREVQNFIGRLVDSSHDFTLRVLLAGAEYVSVFETIFASPTALRMLFAGSSKTVHSFRRISRAEPPCPRKYLAVRAQYHSRAVPAHGSAGQAHRRKTQEVS